MGVGRPVLNLVGVGRPVLNFVGVGISGCSQPVITITWPL